MRYCPDELRATGVKLIEEGRRLLEIANYMDGIETKAPKTVCEVTEVK